MFLLYNAYSVGFLGVFMKTKSIFFIVVLMVCTQISQGSFEASFYSTVTSSDASQLKNSDPILPNVPGQMGKLISLDNEPSYSRVIEQPQQTAQSILSSAAAASSPPVQKELNQKTNCRSSFPFYFNTAKAAQEYSPRKKPYNLLEADHQIDEEWMGCYESRFWDKIVAKVKSEMLVDYAVPWYLKNSSIAIRNRSNNPVSREKQSAAFSLMLEYGKRTPLFNSIGKVQDVTMVIDDLSAQDVQSYSISFFGEKGDPHIINL